MGLLEEISNGSDENIQIIKNKKSGLGDFIMILVA